MDFVDVSSVALLQSYTLSPFKVESKGRLHIPEKYLDVILSLQPEDSEVDWEKIPATDGDWKHVRELLVTGYWMDCWYERDSTLPTPKSEFVALISPLVPRSWPTGKFLRLNSLSPKTQTAPIYILNESIRDRILNTARCQESVALARRTQREVSLVVRDWVDLSHGTEWRCFIFEDRLKAICLNDTVNPGMSSALVISRAQALLQRVRYSLPCVDTVMDIWLSDNSELSESDLVIEFNSYGFYGNSDAGLFDWIEDGAVLYNPDETAVEFRTTP